MSNDPQHSPRPASRPRPQEFNDLGLGTQSAGRGVNKDGSFNVQRLGQPRFRVYELYHQLISMSWTKFMLVVLGAYTAVNFLFAGLYYLIGTEHLSGIAANASESERFMEAFFFSSQTLTTLGYGRIAPVGTAASVAAAAESLLGLLSFALATGLLYGRFSRPQARVLFSAQAVVAPYRDITGLMFRVVNKRSNQLLEVEAEITLSYQQKGKAARSFMPLPLERKKINLFPLSWTIVHPINEESPLFSMSEQELRDTDAELVILIKAFDDAFSQTVHARTSYKNEEIVYGAKFLPMFSRGEHGNTLLDFRRIDAMEKAELPVKKEPVP